MGGPVGSGEEALSGEPVGAEGGPLADSGGFGGQSESVVSLGEDVEFAGDVVVVEGGGEHQGVLDGDGLVGEGGPDEGGRVGVGDAVLEGELPLEVGVDVAVGVVEETVHGAIVAERAEGDDGGAEDERVGP